MEIKREMDNLSWENLCKLWCGEIEKYDEKEIDDDRRTV